MDAAVGAGTAPCLHTREVPVEPYATEGLGQPEPKGQSLGAPTSYCQAAIQEETQGHSGKNKCVCRVQCRPRSPPPQGSWDVSLQVRGTVCIPSACPFLSSSLVSVPRGLGCSACTGCLLPSSEPSGSRNGDEACSSRQSLGTGTGHWAVTRPPPRRASRGRRRLAGGPGAFLCVVS